jgi:hypothetical protein
LTSNFKSESNHGGNLAVNFNEGTWTPGVIGWRPAEWYHPARLAPCHSPPPGMAARQEVLTPNILQAWPRALSAAPALRAQGLRARPLTPRISPFHLKERVQGSARGKMAHSNNLVPQRRNFFYAGASVVIDILPGVQPCHSSQGAVAARGQNLPPAHFPPAPPLPPTPAAYRKSGSYLFIGVI